MYFINARYIRFLWKVSNKYTNLLDREEKKQLMYDYLYVEWDGDCEVRYDIRFRSRRFIRRLMDRVR